MDTGRQKAKYLPKQKFYHTEISEGKFQFEIFWLVLQ